MKKTLKILLIIIIWLIGMSLNIVHVPFPLSCVTGAVFGGLIGWLLGRAMFE